MGEPLLSRKKRQSYMDSQGNMQNCRVNSVLIVAKQNISDPQKRKYNLFNRDMLSEIERLENIVFEVNAEVYSEKSGDGGQYYYEDRDGTNGLCTKQPTGKCGGFNLRVMRTLVPSSVSDPLSLLFSSIPGVALTYPHYFTFDLSQFFGGVETVDNAHNGRVERVEAIREVYCINEYQVDWFMRTFQVWTEWEKQFDNAMRNFHSPYFEIYWVAEYQKQEEQRLLISNMLPKIGATFFALMLWCSAGALMVDAVRSKPWAGVIGVTATMCANVAAFGVCLWLNPTFSPILMAVPLLTLAIGLDDMFIILEAWSRTSPTLPVEERMMLSMNVGGTSIFITFVINLLDFVIGNYTPYPIINKLSVYSCAAMVLDFCCQMTIFCSCLSLFGGSEPTNRHSCCCCVRVPDRATAFIRAIQTQQGPGNMKIVCCAGGLSQTKRRGKSPEKIRLTGTDSDELENGPIHEAIATFLSSFLLRTPARICSICLFFAYITLSLWSVTQMQTGLKPERIYRESSNLFDYTYQQRVLFTRYSHEIQLVLNNEVDYSNSKVQLQLMECISKIESSGYFWGREETSFWLRDFLAWLTTLENGALNGTQCCENVSEMLVQMQRYPDGFLMQGTYGLHAKDIRMDLNATKILKSRIRMRAKDMTGPDRQMAMMTTIRRIVDEYQPDFDMAAYTGDFLLYDQFLSAVPASLYYSSITLMVTLGVAIMMIPHPVCIFWVGVFVVSILVGIVGLMRLWSMDLDSVSLINLLIAISLSSDFVAHATYIFLVTNPAEIPDSKYAKRRQKDKKIQDKHLTAPEIRLKKATFLIDEVSGAAIPAAIGTTLSILAMSTSDAYIFITFFRILFLTVCLSLLHAIVFVPTILSFFGPTSSGVGIMSMKQTNTDFASSSSNSFTAAAGQKLSSTVTTVDTLDSQHPSKTKHNFSRIRSESSLSASSTDSTDPVQIVAFRRRRNPAFYGGLGMYQGGMEGDYSTATWQPDESRATEYFLPATVRAVPVDRRPRLHDGNEWRRRLHLATTARPRRPHTARIAFARGLSRHQSETSILETRHKFHV